MENNRVEIILKKLKKSKFRSGFHLRFKDIKYYNEKGSELIEKHAYEIIKKRLAPSKIENDGRQTPVKGHPVFIAQHATATCCRECLQKWHNIPKHVELNTEQINYIVEVIMAWIEEEINKK